MKKIEVATPTAQAHRFAQLVSSTPTPSRDVGHLNLNSVKEPAFVGIVGICSGSHYLVPYKDVIIIHWNFHEPSRIYIHSDLYWIELQQGIPSNDAPSAALLRKASLRVLWTELRNLRRCQGIKEEARGCCEGGKRDGHTNDTHHMLKPTSMKNVSSNIQTNKNYCRCR